MATFAKFANGRNHSSLEQYEGDFMQLEGQYVKIFKNLPGDRMDLVTVVALEKGQSVRKLDQ